MKRHKLHMKTTFIKGITASCISVFLIKLLVKLSLFPFEEGKVLLGGVVKHLKVDLEPLVDGFELVSR